MTTGIKNGNVSGIYVARITIDPASVATITTAEQTFTVPGVLVGDLAFANKPSCTTGLGLAGVRVTAANTIGVTFVNPTAGGVDAASETWSILVIRPESTPTIGSAISD